MAAGRIVSVDQFRGYTVAGMFIVNFCGGLAAIPAILKHHNTYFSLADTIMPSFLFVVGFSYRLTLLRRLSQHPPREVYLQYFRRSLALVLLSLAVFGFGTVFSKWEEVTRGGMALFVAKLIKADLWEVLAIIGVTQILIMPVIAAGSWARLLALVGCGFGHVLLSYSFNYGFVHRLPNWMDPLWGTTGTGAWDGGVFGCVSWAVAMLAGTLAHDVLVSRPTARAAGWMLACGTTFMLLGYGLSCLSTLYTVESGESRTAGDEGPFAASPVLPPFEKIKSAASRNCSPIRRSFQPLAGCAKIQLLDDG